MKETWILHLQYLRQVTVCISLCFCFFHQFFFWIMYLRTVLISCSEKIKFEQKRSTRVNQKTLKVRQKNAPREHAFHFDQ